MDGNNEPGDAMRILICNERFLFRFGLDRVLIMIGKGMAERGNDIYMMGCRCDEQIVGSFTKTFIPVPPAPLTIMPILTSSQPSGWRANGIVCLLNLSNRI